LGIEIPRYAKEKKITKKSGATKVKLKERFLTANLSTYRHKTYHTNLMILGEWNWRLTAKSGK
jgi:hypothetical protein